MQGTSPSDEQEDESEHEAEGAHLVSPVACRRRVGRLITKRCFRMFASKRILVSSRGRIVSFIQTYETIQSGTGQNRDPALMASPIYHPGLFIGQLPDGSTLVPTFLTFLW